MGTTTTGKRAPRAPRAKKPALPAQQDRFGLEAQRLAMAANRALKARELHELGELTGYVTIGVAEVAMVSPYGATVHVRLHATSGALREDASVSLFVQQDPRNPGGPPERFVRIHWPTQPRGVGAATMATDLYEVATALAVALGKALEIPLDK